MSRQTSLQTFSTRLATIPKLFNCKPWVSILGTLLVIMITGTGCVNSPDDSVLEQPPTNQPSAELPIVTPSPSEAGIPLEQPPEELPVDVRDRLLEFAAEDLAIPQTSLQISAYERATWPDGCLGLANPEEICTMALVEGWQIQVQHNQQTWIYRTDEAARVIRSEN
jgi:hypothetical protein